MATRRGRNGDLKSRERKFSLGDLPDINKAERGELPRGNIPGMPPGTSGAYDPAQGIAPSPGSGVAGPNVPKPTLTVTSIYDAMPLRATKFVVFMRLTPTGGT
jgi:hypothetical protein